MTKYQGCRQPEVGQIALHSAEHKCIGIWLRYNHVIFSDPQRLCLTALQAKTDSEEHLSTGTTLSECLVLLK